MAFRICGPPMWRLCPDGPWARRRDEEIVNSAVEERNFARGLAIFGHDRRKNP